jgi:hypothetical protein
MPGARGRPFRRPARITEVLVVLDTRKNTLAATLLAALLLLTLPAAAQLDAPAKEEVLEKYLSAVGEDLGARRDSALLALLELDEEEKKVFLPLLKAYDEELSALFDARFEVLQEFSAIHDKLNAEKANELAERALDLSDKRTVLHRKYFRLMAEKVSPVVAVQFLQLQGQFETMADLKLATNVPLAVR